MVRNQRLEKFRQVVENKFQIYNSLFMGLPYDKIGNVSMLLPFLYEESKNGYQEGKSPVKILDAFFEKYLPECKKEEQKFELLFKMIQYIERQVVLFDSVEDASFEELFSESDAGTITHLYERAVEEYQLEGVQEKLQKFGVKTVFTAHPTQFYPNSVQRILHDLRVAIIKDDITQIDMLLRQLGKTPFVNKERPTPLDEAMSIVFYLRYVYYETVGELFNKIKQTFKSKNLHINENLLQLGFWPGGDRDGNPFVTADITMQVAQELRSSVLKSYYNHLKLLRRRLSFRGVSEILEALSKDLYANIFYGKTNLSSEEILNYLEKAEKILSDEHDNLFYDLIEDYKDRVKVFGTHFATLDIRQDSSVHQRLIDEIIKKKTSISEFASKEEKVEYLLNNSVNIQVQDFEDELLKDTLKTISQVREIQKNNGERGMYRYIISNSEDTSDVLNVYVLFKLCGYKPVDIKMDFIPLFETIDGLEKSQDIIQKLYHHPIYKNHLSLRKKEQTIMLGFSDGTKHAGYLRANWEIYKAKERLTKVSKENDIVVVFFDGRGGPPARGGGKTHQFYASQGKTIASNRIEITIQGQTITSVFGNKNQAKYNFEQLLTAGIENDVFSNSKTELNAKQRELINKLSDISYQKYSELKQHDKFIPYLLEMSTLQYYGKTNIGSRPSKRGKDSGLKFEDLRAIPFVGSWSQLRQNIPGYFGLGTALNEIKKEGKFEDLKTLYEDSYFFKTLILNSMMSMNKTYFPLTYYMREDPEYGGFWKVLYDEYELSKQVMLEITGHKELMEEESISKKSVQIREKIVLPLLTIQQYALLKIKDEENYKEVYEKLVTRSLFGNINASRNSA